MATRILFFLFLMSFANAGAQDLIWAKSMGGPGYDHVQALATDAAGNVYTAGTFEDSVDFDPGNGILNLYTFPSSRNGLFVQKLDVNGNLVWAKAVPGIGLPQDGISLTLDAAQNVYVTGGYTYSVDFDPGAGTYFLSPANSAFILKLNLDGDFIWARSIEGTGQKYSNSILVDDTGNVYLAGMFYDTLDTDPNAGIYNLVSQGLKDMFLIKLDSSANFIWAVSIGGMGNEEAVSLQVDASGLYIAGNFGSPTDFDPGAGIHGLGNNGMFLLKLAHSGAFIWVKAVEGEVRSPILGECLAADNSGNLYIMGGYYGSADFDPGTGLDTSTSSEGDDAFIMKMDTSGSYIWTKRLAGSGTYGMGFSIAVNNQGEILASGQFDETVDFDPGVNTYYLNAGNSGPLGYLLRLDTSGNFIWAHMFEGNDNFMFAVAYDNTGNHLAAGLFKDVTDFDPNSPIFNLTSNGAADAAILKLASTTGITQTSPGSQQILIYPNPTTKTIHISAPQTIDNIIATDMLGRKVYEAAFAKATATVDITIPGVYFITVSSGDSRTTEKIIVY